MRRRTVWAGQTAFVQKSSRLLPCSVNGCAHDGQHRRRHDLALLAGALRVVEHAGDERDHVARAADQDGVADLDVAGADDLLVRQRGAGDRGATDEDRLEPGDRGDLAGLAHVPDHVVQHGGLLLGGELEGDRAARRATSGCPRRRTRRGRPGAGRRRRGRSRGRCAACSMRGDQLLRLGRGGAVTHLGDAEAELAQTRVEVGVGALRLGRSGRTRRTASAGPRRPSDPWRATCPRRRCAG